MATPAQLIQWAKSIEAKYGPKIAKQLGVQQVPLSYQVVDPESSALHGGAAAFASINGTVFIPADADGADVGGIIFEIVNQYNVAANGEDRNTMELAEYVRRTALGEPVDGEAARFARLSPKQFKFAAANIRAGTFRKRMLRTDYEPQAGDTPGPAPGTEARIASTTTGPPPPPGGGGSHQQQTTAPVKLPYPNPVTEHQYQANAQAMNEAKAGVTGDGTGGPPGGPPPPPPPDDTADTIRPGDYKPGFASQVQIWHIETTKNIQQLINEAAKKGWTNDKFIYYLRQTPEYHDAFPGITRPNGTQKMDEETYLSNLDSYNATATQNGLNLGPKDEAWLFRQNVSPDEFSDRAAGIRSLRTNADLFTQFGRSLVQLGVAKPGEVTKQELLKFVLDEGNAEWYNVYNLTQARYGATQAGIELGKKASGYLALNPGQVAKIAQKDLSPEELQSKFEQTAKDFLTTLPLSKIQQYGLTKRDILQARFGGKKQADVLQKMEHITNQEEAFYKDRASAQVYATAEGVESLGGSGTKAAQ